MKRRQRIERLWAVWMWCDEADPPCWGSYAEAKSQREAEELAKTYAERWPGDVFTAMRVTHERVGSEKESEPHGR